MWDDLRVLTMAGTTFDNTLTVSSTMRTLQGIFSVNLRRALAGAGPDEDNPAFVGDAVEFFAFGTTTRPAVTSC